MTSLLYWKHLEEASISVLRAKDRYFSSAPLFLFSVGVWYNLNGYVSSQVSRCISFVLRKRDKKSEN